MYLSRTGNLPSIYKVTRLSVLSSFGERYTIAEVTCSESVVRIHSSSHWYHRVYQYVVRQASSFSIIMVRYLCNLVMNILISVICSVFVVVVAFFKE